jgi:hypothetical protein
MAQRVSMTVADHDATAAQKIKKDSVSKQFDGITVVKMRNGRITS